MAAPSPSEETTLLASVLDPLLEDFQYWFGRSLEFLSPEAIIRLLSVQAETQTALMLLKATDGQGGVDTTKVMGWPRLVMEGWAMARRHRAQSAEAIECESIYKMGQTGYSQYRQRSARG